MSRRSSLRDWIMPDGHQESKQLTLQQLEDLRDGIRVSLDHARDELERIEGLILIARFREARDPNLPAESP